MMLSNQHSHSATGVQPAQHQQQHAAGAIVASPTCYLATNTSTQHLCANTTSASSSFSSQSSTSSSSPPLSCASAPRWLQQPLAASSAAASGSSTGKRSRSNSSCSSASSSGASSIFSHDEAAGCESSSGSSCSSSSSSVCASSAATSPADSRTCLSPSQGKRKSRRARRTDVAGRATSVESGSGSSQESYADSSSSSSQESISSFGSSQGSSIDADPTVATLGETVRALGFTEPACSALSATFSAPPAAAALAAQNDSQPLLPQQAAAQPSLKGGFVDSLVDVAVATLDSIWHAPPVVASAASDDVSCGDVLGLAPACGGDHDIALDPSSDCAVSAGLPLQLFIRETLRRSRTSCSTLQAALLYCVRARPAVAHLRRQALGMPSKAPKSAWPGLAQPSDKDAQSLLCARRMFLAATMVASKFLQDRNYSNRAWSRISGLPLHELGCVERAFLNAVGYRLDVGPKEWDAWIGTVGGVARKQQALAASASAATATALAAEATFATVAAPSPASTSSNVSTPTLATRIMSSGSNTPTPTKATVALPPALALARRTFARAISDMERVAPYDSALAACSPLGVGTAAAAAARKEGDTTMMQLDTTAAQSLTPTTHQLPAPFPLARCPRSRGLAHGRSHSVAHHAHTRGHAQRHR